MGHSIGSALRTELIEHHAYLGDSAADIVAADFRGNEEMREYVTLTSADILGELNEARPSTLPVSSIFGETVPYCTEARAPR